MPLFVAQSEISITEEPNVSAAEVAELYIASGIHRPTNDIPRIEKMLQHSDIKVCVRHSGLLVGLARGITDQSFCCYLADLAVHRDYQKNGIGKAMVDAVRSMLHDEVSIMMLSNPEANDFNPPLGFQKVGNCWMMPRVR
jgi:GNAT superfamily N-acetyltransferase